MNIYKAEIQEIAHNLYILNLKYVKLILANFMQHIFLHNFSVPNFSGASANNCNFLLAKNINDSLSKDYAFIS